MNRFFLNLITLCGLLFASWSSNKVPQAYEAYKAAKERVTKVDQTEFANYKTTQLTPFSASQLNAIINKNLIADGKLEEQLSIKPKVVKAKKIKQTNTLNKKIETNTLVITEPKTDTNLLPKNIESKILVTQKISN
jgi:hypothetical protein